MIIAVGSTNQTKIRAVKDAIALYPHIFPDPKIKGVKIDIPEFGHPKNLKETVTGAIERAQKAFQDCNYSFGLEGGLLEVPMSKTGVMETTACAIYDGKDVVLGLGPAYEWPPKVTQLIKSGKADASLAFKKLGYTKEEKLGAVKGGIIKVLTEGRIGREDFMKYAIIMAMIQLEKPEYY